MTDMLGNTSLTSYADLLYRCTVFKVSNFITTGTLAIKILLLLPLSAFVLHHGHQKWRRQRSFKAASHSDIFAYHLAVMELIWVFGCFFLVAGLYTDYTLILRVGMFLCYIPFYGEQVFNLMTCVERYLAVVHPLIYRGLKNHRGVRIRSVSVGCAWLLCLGMTTMFRAFRLQQSKLIAFFLSVSSILILSFCSVSVLCVLIRSGPVEGGGDKEGVDRSRRRAFCTITIITSVVWLWFVGLLACHSLEGLVSDSIQCLVYASFTWFGVPCSLVSPLLYLHKTRKLSCRCTQ